jgi:hypothetical protein
MIRFMFDLEEGNPTFALRADGRPQLPVPPPVKLLAVADVVVPVTAGNERWLDTMYVRCLGFEVFDPSSPARAVKYEETIRRPAGAPERLPGKSPEDLPPVPGPRHYRAENLALHFDVVEKLTPEQLKLIQVEVPQLEEIVRRLLERQIPYERFRGLLPGLVHVQVFDPVGHVIQISEGRDLPL